MVADIVSVLAETLIFNRSNPGALSSMSSEIFSKISRSGADIMAVTDCAEPFCPSVNVHLVQYCYMFHSTQQVFDSSGTTNCSLGWVRSKRQLKGSILVKTKASESVSSISAIAWAILLV